MKEFNAIIAEMRKDYYRMGRSSSKLDTDLMDMLRSFADQLVPAYASEMDAIVVSKNAEIDTLKDQVAQLAEMQNPDIQVQKTIALEKRLNKQKAINKNLVDQNAELLADLKRSNEQYQHLVKAHGRVRRADGLRHAPGDRGRNRRPRRRDHRNTDSEGGKQ